MSTTAPPKRIQSDFVLVDTLAIFPSACTLCNGNKGPAIDTMRTNNVGRVYVCVRCLTLAARVAGLVKGERHVELLNAGEKLAEFEKQVAARDAQIQEQLEALARYSSRIQDTGALLEAERGRTEAMRHQLGTIEEAARQARTTSV